MSRIVEEALKAELFVEQVGFGEDGMVITFSRQSEQKPDSFSIVNVTAFMPFTGENAHFRELAFAELQQKLQWCVMDGEEELMSGSTGSDDPEGEGEVATPW